jgi:hypothetical protein
MGPSPLRVATIWSRQPDSVPQVAAEQPRFDFRPGIPDTSRFPYPTWRRCVNARTPKPQWIGFLQANVNDIRTQTT